MTWPRDYDEHAALARIEAVHFEAPEWIDPPDENEEEEEYDD